MRVVKQSSARVIMIFMTDSADHITGKTGLTLTLTVSKSGSAFEAIAPTVVERGSGWYALELTAVMLNTLGDYAIHATASGADPTDVLLDIVAYDPSDSAALGLTRLNATITSRLAAADYTAPDNDGIAIAEAASLAAQLAAEAAAQPGDEMSLDTASVNSILDGAIDGTYTLRQLLRLVSSAMTGKWSRDVQGRIHFRDINDTKDRLVVTATGAGRVSVTVDAS